MGAVIWAALDSSTFLWYDLNVDRSTSALASYLDGGGRLFLSAQRADSLEREAPGFYSQYLHSSDAQACVGVRDVQGTSSATASPSVSKGATAQVTSSVPT